MIEVLKQMVQALENSVDLVIEDAYNAEQLYANVPTKQARIGGLKFLADEHQKAIQAGRQAIAELESQEPVAWVAEDICEGQIINGRPRKIWWECEKGVGKAIYTHPPQRSESSGKPAAWVGLTDEDWKEIEDMPDTFDQGVAWAQAKLKDKNT